MLGMSFGLRLWRIGAAFQILEILKYSSGLKRGPAATLNQNPNFETASRRLEITAALFLETRFHCMENRGEHIGQT